MLTEINLKYLASVADKNNTFESLKAKALLYELEPPVVRYDKTLLKVELAGDLNYGGMIKETGSQILKIESKCLGKEDAFMEVQLMILKQAPTSVMIKRMCSLGNKSQDGLLGTLIKTFFKLLLAILKFAILIAVLGGIALLCDRFLISRFIDPYLSSLKGHSKLNQNGRQNEPLGDIVELRTLTQKKQYGTLN